MVFGLFGPRGRSDLGAFWPPSSPSRYVSSDAFSQAKVLSVPGKRELTVPAREAPPTVETDLMELDMYFVGTPLGQSFFFRLKRISEALLDNSFWAVSFNSPDPFQWFFAHEIL